MKVAEYSNECDYCGSETRVVVFNEREEPLFCSMCGQESGFTFEDGEEDDYD